MEDLPKGLAASNTSKIAKRLKSVSGGRILDVATAGGGFINTLMKTLKDYDSFVGIDYCASATSKKEMESARSRRARALGTILFRASRKEDCRLKIAIIENAGNSFFPTLYERHSGNSSSILLL